MKIAFWLAFTFLIRTACLSQAQSDSLKTLLAIAKQQGKESEAAFLLSSIGWEFLSSKMYDSALTYYYQALNSSEIYVDLRASSLVAIGMAYDYKGYSDSSIFYYNSALVNYARIGDTTHTAAIENNLAILYKNKGMYTRALEMALKSLPLLEKYKPDRLLASRYNTIGAVYGKTGDLPNALRYYTKALQIRHEIDYQIGVGQSYNNLGEVYIRMHQYDSALSMLFQALAIKKELYDSASQGTTLNSIGNVYLDLNMPEEAERYYNESRRIKKATGERLEEAIALNNLGKLKLHLGDLRQAEYYIKAAEKLVRETDALDELRENLELQVSLYVAKEDYPMALQSTEELMAVKDSLLNKEKAESLLVMQTVYETEKKEEQIASLQKEQELRRREIITKKIWIWGLVIIITLMAAVGALLFLGYRQSQKNKKRVETLLKELHHRVKNNLQILSSIINLQSQNVKDESALLAIRSNESRVNTMALIHKKLYRSEGNNAINMEEYTEELVQFLIHTYGFDKNTINFALKSEPIFLDVDVAIPVGLIINEVVSNALKYAYIDNKNPMLEVNLRVLEKHELAVVVSDNGPGISETAHAESHRSFGLRMVQTLTKELKGKLSIKTHPGTTFSLFIPIA